MFQVDEDVCEKRKEGVNVTKSNGMRCNTCEGEPVEVRLNGEELQEVRKLKYLRSTVLVGG